MEFKGVGNWTRLFVRLGSVRREEPPRAQSLGGRPFPRSSTKLLQAPRFLLGLAAAPPPSDGGCFSTALTERLHLLSFPPFSHLTPSSPWGPALPAQRRGESRGSRLALKEAPEPPRDLVLSEPPVVPSGPETLLGFKSAMNS